MADTDAATSSLTRALKNRSFAWVFAGQTISQFGDRLHRIALMWWVLEETKSGVAMGVVTLLSTLPMLLFLAIGGVVVDRVSRVRVMISSDIARGVLTAMIAVLAYTDNLTIMHLYAITIAFGFADAFFGPAFHAVIPEILPDKSDLTSANSLVALSQQLAMVGGPAIGAVLVASGGTPYAFAIDAASFFLSALCLRPLPKMDRKPSEHSNALREIREGLAVVLQNTWLWVGILMFALTNAIGSAAYHVTLPFLIKDELGLGVSALSAAHSTFGVGAILAAVWLGRRTQLRHRGLYLYITAIASGVCLLVIGVAATIYLVCAAALVRGLSLVGQNLVWETSMQAEVSPDKLGRVYSIDIFFSYSLMPVGYFAVGHATDRFGPSVIFVGAAIAIMLLSAVALLHPKVRRFD